MKKRAAILFLAFFSLCLVGCAIARHENMYGSDKNIAAESDRYNMVQFTGSTDTENQYSFSVSSINGTKTIWNYTATEAGEEVTLTATLCETSGGWVKMVLIDPEGNVTTLVEANAQEQQQGHSFTAGQGTYRVKLVGKGDASAKGKLEFSHGAF